VVWEKKPVAKKNPDAEKEQAYAGMPILIR